ncbi:MAG: Rossmann-like domain-containing protein [bacterium]
MAETVFRTSKLCGDSVRDLNILEIHMESPYTIVKLTNGDLGVAFNFDHESQPFKICENRHNWPAIATGLLDRARTDTLLTDHEPRELYELSVQVATSSALSQSQNIRDKDLADNGLIVDDFPIPLADISRKGDTVSVIGFGGYFCQALYDPNVHQVLVSDLLLSRSSEMQENAARFLQQFPNKLQFFDDAVSSEAIVLEADVACITASALCNGTMDGLLQAAREGKCREVIVYGHSGGMLSGPLFEHGVTIHLRPRIKRAFLAETKKFMSRIKDPEVRSVVRTVLQEDNFYDFIDVNLKAVTVKEKPISFAKIRRSLKKKTTNGLHCSCII